MATVPYAPIPTVTPSSDSGLPYQTAAGATPDAFGANIGQAEQGLGKQIEHVGDMLEKHAVFYQQRENQAEADQGFVDNATKIGEVKSWYNSLEGKNAFEAYPDYVKKLNAVRDTALGDISNPEAKRMFEREFNRRMVFDIEAGAGHAAVQQKVFQHNTSNAVVTIAKQDSALDPENEDKFNNNIQTIKQKVDEQASSNGWGPEQTQVEKQKQVGQAIEARLASLSKTNPLAARDLLEKQKGELDGLTYDKATRSVNQGIIQVQSRIDADHIVSNGFGVSDNLVENVKKLEGFEPAAKWDYKQFTSGYGTRAGKAGEPIDKATAETRLRDELGRAAQIVDQVNPNLPSGTRDALISLTFNAGGDWIKSGLGQKIRSGDIQGALENFQQYTQAGGKQNPGLVNRRATEAGWWGGPTTNAMGSDRMTNALVNVPKRAEELFPDDPGNRAVYEDTLRTRVNAEFSGLKTGLVAAARENKNTVYNEVLNPDKPITSTDQLSAQAQDAYNRMPADQQFNVRKRLAANAAADPNPMTNENYARWQELDGMAKNPNTREQFADIDLGVEKIPRPLLQKLQNQQSNIKTLGQADLKISSLMNKVRPMLNDAQIFESKDPTKATEYNKFYGQFQDEVQRFETLHKKLPNDKEVQELAAKLIRTTNDNGWFFQGNPRQFQTDVPKDFETAALAAGRARGRMLSPTDIRYLWNNRKPSE